MHRQTGPAMKITSNTDNRLMIDHAPWVLGYGTIVAFLVMMVFTARLLLAGDWITGLVVGACAILFPGGLFCTLTREQLIFDRDTGDVIVRERSLLRGYRKRRLPLAALQDVQVRRILSTSAYSHGFRDPSYNTVIRFDIDGANVFITCPGDWGHEAQAWTLKHAIEDWIAGPDPH